MRLGLFGGTFNPIHIGHLVLAESAREQCRLDQVWFVPTAIPPHKPARGMLEGRARLDLVRRAIRGNPSFWASDLELRLGGISYTLRTVTHIRQRHPAAKLFLIVGQDMLSVRWRGFDELRRLCTFVVAQRPESPSARLFPGARRIAMPQLGISSSMIRERLRRGASIRYLVPDAVGRYLAAHRCYRGSGRGRGSARAA